MWVGVGVLLAGSATQNALAEGEEWHGAGCDCNENGILDVCDLTCAGTAYGCPYPGLLYQCSYFTGCGQGEDCNSNDIPDDCDIADETSSDTNENGVPDECECDTVESPSAESDWSPYAEKARYISFEPNNAGEEVAFFIGDAPQWGTCLGTGTACQTAADCPSTCSGSGDPCPPRCPFLQICRSPNCVGGSLGSGAWVGEPDELDTALVVDDPVYRVWTEAVVHVGDCEIVPSESYKVHAVHFGCDPEDGDSYSDPLTLTTALWGDIVGYFDGNDWTPAQGVINISDTQAMNQAFTSHANAPPMTWADLGPEVPNRIININDVQLQMLAAQGNSYPFSDPDQCP